MDLSTPSARAVRRLPPDTADDILDRVTRHGGGALQRLRAVDRASRRYIDARLRRVAVGTAQFDGLPGALPRLSALESLSFECTSEAHVWPLTRAAHALHGLASLTSLTANAWVTWAGSPRRSEPIVDSLAACVRAAGRLRRLQLTVFGRVAANTCAVLIAAAEGLQDLEVLAMPRVVAEEQGSRALCEALGRGAWPRLQELQLMDLSLYGAQCLSHATHLSSLHTLRLRGTPGARGDDTGGEWLHQLASGPVFAALRVLELDSCCLGEAGLAPLRGLAMPRLEELLLPGNDLDDAAAVDLAAASLPSLRRLMLSNNSLTERGAAALAGAAWVAWGLLKEVDMSINQVGSGGAAALAAVPLPSLRSLSLRFAGLTDDALSHVAGAPWSEALTRLDLGHNHRLGRDPEPWARLAHAPLRCLRSLDLSATGQIHDEAVMHVAGAMWLDGLGELWLRGCVGGAIEALRGSPLPPGLVVHRTNA